MSQDHKNRNAEAHHKEILEHYTTEHENATEEDKPVIGAEANRRLRDITMSRANLEYISGVMGGMPAEPDLEDIVPAILDMCEDSITAARVIEEGFSGRSVGPSVQDKLQAKLDTAVGKLGKAYLEVWGALSSKKVAELEGAVVKRSLELRRCRLAAKRKREGAGQGPAKRRRGSV